MTNAVFAKCHCNPPEVAQVFKTFIEHNYQTSFIAPADSDSWKLSDQKNWLAKYSDQPDVSFLSLKP